jgi:hypothetical protein
MLAPVKVLHLPDPAELATEKLGPERHHELLAAAEPLPIADVIAEVLAAVPPARPSVPVSTAV